MIERESQRKGYGLEVCRAILEYAKEELGFERVQALVQEENNASAALLERLGFEYERNVTEQGTEYRLMIRKL